MPNPANIYAPALFFVGGASGDNGTLSYTWDFGDGSTGTGNAATHMYTAPGIYHATVQVNEGVASTSAGVDVTVVFATTLPGTNPIGTLQGTVRFAKKADTLTLTTLVQLQPNQRLSDVPLDLTIGLLHWKIQANGKGLAVLSDGHARMRIVKKTPQGPVVSLSFQVSGQYKATIATGLPLDVHGLPTLLPVELNYNAIAYSRISHLAFKNGMAKFGGKGK